MDQIVNKSTTAKKQLLLHIAYNSCNHVKQPKERTYEIEAEYILKYCPSQTKVKNITASWQIKTNWLKVNLRREKNVSVDESQA